MAICIYAIMRNEVDRVEQWAMSTTDADHRLVLDTGSTDGTPEALTSFGVEVRHAIFEPFRFDDARNTALALVPATIDLCLRLDGDEVPDGDWRAAFEQVYRPSVPRYRYVVQNHGRGWGQIVRDDLHARHGFRWQYPTHEILVGPPAPSPSVVDGLVVHHWPDETKYRGFNLSVLAQEVARDPHDLRMAFYYARELWYTGHYNECRERMLRFLAMPGGWGPERCEAWRILAAIDDFPERWLWHAVGEAPERREPWCDLARLYLTMGRDAEAEAMMLCAARRNDPTIYTTQSDCWGTDFERLREAADVIDLGD